MAESFYDALKTTLKEGETLVVGTITRVIPTGDDAAPLLFFTPDDPKLAAGLHLEGHRLSTGELQSTHEAKTPSGPVPRQFDSKRIALDAKTAKPGGKVALVHLDKQR